MGRELKMKLSALLASSLGLVSGSPVEHKPGLETKGHNQWINCYYTNWSQYRPGDGKYFPEDIDATLCTHMYFSFAKMCKGGGGWTLCPYEWNDQDEPWTEGLYTRMQKKKSQNPELKTLIAVGGWNHGSSGFKEMVATTEGIEIWVKNAIKYAQDNGFDGVDLDWEYPAKTTTTTTTTTKSLAPGECAHGQYYPDPDHCEKYMLCSNNVLIPFDCQPGTVWDDQKNLCNLASAVDCCDGQRPCPSL